jgi:hypothetical protein
LHTQRINHSFFFVDVVGAREKKREKFSSRGSQIHNHYRRLVDMSKQNEKSKRERKKREKKASSVRV